jgi:tetratricopeptide (TPR) repeat protein
VFLGQESQVSPKLHGRVVRHGASDSELIPVINVAVRRKFYGNETRSYAIGAFDIAIGPLRPGESTTLEIEYSDYGTDGIQRHWVIFSPLDGHVTIPHDLDNHVETVVIVPRGSHLLWSHDRLERLLIDLVERAKAQEATTGTPYPVDYARHVEQWAEEYGLSPEQAHKEITKWITSITDTTMQEAWESVRLNDFETAAGLFEKSAVSLEPEVELQVETIVERRRLAGNAFYLAHDFPKALENYHLAARFVTRERSAHLWAALWVSISECYRQLSLHAGSSSTSLLEKGLDAARRVSEELSPETTDWALGQLNLGNLLTERGMRLSGEKGTDALSQAVDALHAALSSYSQFFSPEAWAAAQNTLGVALLEQSTRVSFKKGVALNAQAVSAFRAAIEALAKEQFPWTWARAQTNLGSALSKRGEQLSTEEGVALLVEATRAYRAALEVYTKEESPYEWASTQSNYGNALMNQAVRVTGEEKHRLIAEVVDKYARALEVFTRDEFPEPWVGTQINLGNALSIQGVQTTGKEGIDHLVRAVAAYRTAIEAVAKEHRPLTWAMAQANLGNTLSELDFRTTEEEGFEHISDAVDAFSAALEVYTLEHSPDDWVRIKTSLYTAHRRLSQYSSGKKRLDLQVKALLDYPLDMLGDEDKEQMLSELNRLSWLLATNPEPRFRDGKAAVDLARRACEITNFTNPNYLDTLAAAYAESGDFEAAIKCQTKAIRLLASAHQFRLDLYLQHESFHEPMIEFPADSPMSHHNQWIALLKSGQFDEAIKAFDKANDLPQEQSDVYRIREALLTELGIRERVLRALNQARWHLPVTVTSSIELGTVLRELGMFKEALLAFDEANDLQSDNPNVHRNRAATFLQMDRYEEALRALDAVVHLQPDDAKVYVSRGMVLDRLDRPEDAVQAFDKAISLLPNEPDYHYYRGTLLGRRLGLFDDALNAFDRAIELHPQNPEFHHNRGATLDELGRSEDALQAYDKAIALQPESPTSYNNRGITLGDLGRHEEALASYNRSIQLKPDYPAVFYNMAATLDALGRHEEAILAYDQCILLDPDHYGVHHNRAVSLMILGRHEEALSSIDRSIELYPDVLQSHAIREAIRAILPLQREQEQRNR